MQHYKTIFPLERFKSIPTPFYYYDTELLELTLKELKSASNFPGYKVHYAVKANSEPRIISQIAKAGLGADAVSIHEVERAIASGISPKNIVFAGVGKTDNEIITALKLHVGILNIESVEELQVISDLAKAENVVANVALRVNPDIDAHTHHYITTGLSENKFGIDRRMLAHALELTRTLPNIHLRGLHFHIGSQITDLTPYSILCQRINELLDRYSDYTFETINLGGGLGIDYDNPDSNPIPPFQELFNIVHQTLNQRPGQEVHFELGRAIVAQCGSLITRALYIKKGIDKKFLIVDGGMTELIRPALYQAHHTCQNLTAEAKNLCDTQLDYQRNISPADCHEKNDNCTPTEIYDVVGPVCESSDVFAHDERLPISHRGDFIAFRSAGAYGQAMASNYNLRPLPQAVFPQ